ncbi:MAG: hypothetical protein JRD89_10860 [Deltaproteobacteria bacterium]|nr:hypothetical protein [Deltaproteobacteria bacterium]
MKQVAPAEEGTWCSGDECEVELLTRYVLYEQPTTLTLKLWNEDDTYSHTPIFRFWTCGFSEAFPELYITSTLGFYGATKEGIITL